MPLAQTNREGIEERGGRASPMELPQRLFGVALFVVEENTEGFGEGSSLFNLCTF